MHTFFFALIMLLFVGSVSAQGAPVVTPRAVDVNNLQIQPNRPVSGQPVREGRPQISPRRGEMISPRAPQEKRENMLQLRQQDPEAFCEEMRERISEKKQTFEQREVSHGYRYQRMMERLKKLSERFSAEGYDVSELETAIKGLEEKIANVEKAHTALKAAISETEQLECSATRGLGRVNKIEAEEELESLKDAKQEIIEYFRQYVVPAIQGLREQLEEASASADLPKPRVTETEDTL